LQFTFVEQLNVDQMKRRIPVVRRPSCSKFRKNGTNWNVDQVGL